MKVKMYHFGECREKEIPNEIWLGAKSLDDRLLLAIGAWCGYPVGERWSGSLTLPTAEENGQLIGIIGGGHKFVVDNPNAGGPW